MLVALFWSAMIVIAAHVTVSTQLTIYSEHTFIFYICISLDWTWGNSIFLDIQNAAIWVRVGACQEVDQTPPVVLCSLAVW